MKLALHWKILIGMVLGVLLGLIASNFGGKDLVVDWVKPFGTIFINSLKMIAIPLIIVSLVKGVSDLRSLSSLSLMGFRTVVLYLFTTVVAITIGLLIVNIVQPGKTVGEATSTSLKETFAKETAKKREAAAMQQEKGPLQALVDVVPDNVVKSATDNGSMLQVIFFAIFFGIGLILVDSVAAEPVKKLFDGLNEVILKMIDLIMLFAPYGVFALLASLVVEVPSADVLLALIYYAMCVVAGLAIMILVFYPIMMKFLAGVGYVRFFKAIAPAQLLAFSTSSSAATLPVTMERVEEHLGVEKEVASFVLPIGATVNMDGTSLYQAVAAVFIAQVLGMDLGVQQQLTIVASATLASIGSAAVPGAGVVMLVIVLEAIGVPAWGIALIFAVDRPLDMCRTMVNVTGDASISGIVAKSVGKLAPPKTKNWDDNLDEQPEASDSAE